MEKIFTDEGCEVDHNYSDYYYSRFTQKTSFNSKLKRLIIGIWWANDPNSTIKITGKQDKHLIVVAQILEVAFPKT